MDIEFSGETEEIERAIEGLRKKGVSVDPTGFRVGLEVMVRGRYRTFTEVPYVQTPRPSGGKLDPGELFSYLFQLTSLISYRYRHPHQRRRWTRVVS